MAPGKEEVLRTKTRALENISMNVIQEKMGEWERMGDFWLKPNRGKGGISPFSEIS